MNPEEKKEWDELHNEHAIIWRELEQWRTDIIVSRKKGTKNSEAEAKNKNLTEKLEKKDKEIKDFLERYNY